MHPMLLHCQQEVMFMFITVIYLIKWQVTVIFCTIKSDAEYNTAFYKCELEIFRL